MDKEEPKKANGQQAISALPVPKLYQELATRPSGLTKLEAGERLQRFGLNTIREAATKPLWQKFLANFTHVMAILLWAGSIVAFIGGLPQLGVAVLMVNIINGIFSFWQEYRADKATEKLRQLLPLNARVLREGREESIPAYDLVPGDIVLLSEGDRISGDCRLVQDIELRVDQSMLTGEADPVYKMSEPVIAAGMAHYELPNLLFAGTHVVAGKGTAVVFSTGMNTEFGRIAALTQNVKEEPSPLQKEMVSVTRVVTVVAVSVGLVFFLLAATLTHLTWEEGFIFSLGMIVAFVPEGLLPTVTLALAMGVQRMAKRHALIKRLSAVETLGCTTVICTDKTGTLTQNEMTVSRLWLPGRHLKVTGAGYSPQGEILENDCPIPSQVDLDLRQMLSVGALCNNARLTPPTSESSRWAVFGDPTEAALLALLPKAGMNLEDEMRQTPRVRELPFESRRRRMSTIHQTQASQVVYVKGAPKETLDISSSVWIGGRQVELTPDLKAQAMAVNDEYAREGLRVLALAKRPAPGNLCRYEPETVESDLTFLGLVAMADPPRPEVAEAVGKCHRSGIRIIMITGDYGLTAETIARRIGIIRGDHPRIVTGPDLENLTDADLEEILKDEVIFARSSPENKLRIVSVLKEMGHVVAVTGDGVNDAPALKKADIGVAMGISGTDVAKEAADIILLDDNFASIVNAIEEGRAVYSNIKKFATYIFTSNTPEAVPFILFVFSGTRIPLALSVMEVLSIDLGTDLVPGLALGAELPEPGIMDKPPRSLKEHVVTRGLLVRAYLFLGPIQSAVVIFAFFFQYWTNGYRGQWLNLPSSGVLYLSATAMALAAVVTTQIGNLFAQRTERASFFRTPLFNNRLVWVGIGTELTLIFLIVYVPAFQRFFGTAAFAPRNWIFLFAWTPLLLLVDEVRKAIMRRRERALKSRPRTI